MMPETTLISSNRMWGVWCIVSISKWVFKCSTHPWSPYVSGTHGNDTLLTTEPFFVALFRSLKLGLKFTALWTSPPPHGKSRAEARAAADFGPLLLPQADPPPFALGKTQFRAPGFDSWQQGQLEGLRATLNSCRLGASGCKTPICRP